LAKKTFYDVTDHWSRHHVGSGITKSHLLIINKIDIAEQVHASLDVAREKNKKIQ
jgi:Ni2+-binding GTPase involved in maturation of urease and hydrogenase